MSATASILDTLCAREQDWPEPSPLVAETESRPYPLASLPGDIGDAVLEVLNYVQCPAALCACSALAAVSVACQGLADVRRADGLQGPISLFLLAIAQSGERKTTSDGHFAKGIAEWEAEQAEIAKPDLARSRAKLDAWEAQREGLISQIRTNAAKNAAIGELQQKVEQFEMRKPELHRFPRLLYTDSTPEAMAWNLAHKWPSAAVISSEAGIVFGGHAMNSESILRNLALLNQLWDGGTVKIDRRSSESFMVKGARLTMGLAVQPETVRSFFDNSKGLARGTGFAARFLIAHPQSTQGFRPFKEAPANWPRLTAFRQRLRQRLEDTHSLSKNFELNPPILALSAEAQAEWIRFHDEVETELRPIGELTDVRDVASKAADNAARLGALFHVFVNGPHGDVQLSHMVNAATIVTWHIYEAQRFLGGLSNSKAVNNAVKLDAWLVARCKAQDKRSLPKNDVRQFGPNSVREAKALDQALADLDDLYRIRLRKDGKQLRIHVNPKLLGGSNGLT